MPDVFEPAVGCTGDAHDACIAQLADLLLNDGVVRDLRRGEWRQSVLSNIARCTPAGRQLFEALVNANRLREIEPTPLRPATTPEEWLWEARRSEELGLHDRRLQAALAMPELAEQEADAFVVSIHRLHAAPWWKSRSCSLRLDRQTNDYVLHLRPVLRHSNSAMFIDPNIDPQKPSYSEFHQILTASIHTEGKPDLIEIHRSCKDSAGKTLQEQYPSRNDWIDRFADLGRLLHASNLRGKVFIWEDFHDRYLISNLIGLSIPHGFDICTDRAKYPLKTTWSRLSRKDADEIRSDFDAANRQRQRFEPFEIGT
jgi:hypothetical protein